MKTTNHRARPARFATACALLGVVGAGAHAQEAMYTAAATMPSPGVAVWRQQWHVWQFGRDPVGGSEGTLRIEAMNSLQYGIVRDLSINVDVPLETRLIDRGSEGTQTTTSVEDVDLTFKWRLWQSDPGGIDTKRFALLGGTRLRTDEQFGVDPHLGAVYTQVMGRHGFNAEVHYVFNTREHPVPLNFGGEGADDALALNLAYVFRFWPEQFSGDSEGAWYVTAEANTLYETSGDWEVRFSPGLMYEGRRWGFEIMGQVPVYQHVRDRPELDWGVGAGFRLIF